MNDQTIPSNPHSQNDNNDNYSQDSINRPTTMTTTMERDNETISHQNQMIKLRQTIQVLDRILLKHDHYRHQYDQQHDALTNYKQIDSEYDGDVDVDDDDDDDGSSASDSGYDSDNSSIVDSLILTRARFAKNRAEKAGLILQLDDEASRRLDRRRLRRQRLRKWRDAGFFSSTRNVSKDKTMDDGSEDDHDEWPRSRPRTRKRDLLRSAVHRDSLVLARERLPDLVHFVKALHGRRNDTMDTDEESSESTGVDSLDLIRERVPSIKSLMGGAPESQMESTFERALRLDDSYTDTPPSCLSPGQKVVTWYLADGEEKKSRPATAQQRLDEGLLKDGPKGGVNCAA